MKRVNNIFEKICSLENLELADKRARKGKRNSYGVKHHDHNRKENLKKLSKSMMSGDFKTSKYTVFEIFEPKHRVIYRLPYFPDRIAHHAIMNVIEKPIVNMLTADTYGCVKGRGIHSCAKKIKTVLQKDTEQTKYCLKLDIRKYYPSVNHDILKVLMRRKFKDASFLNLVDNIIDSAPGLPIGNYLSQYLSNFYLAYFDHWLKEDLNVQYYFRYVDDMVILADNKFYLHNLLKKIKTYLRVELKQTVKGNHQVFPVKNGIDFLGYKFYHTHTLLRKSIKINFARAVKLNKSKSCIESYKGWVKHCDANNLLKKIAI